MSLQKRFALKENPKDFKYITLKLKLKLFYLLKRLFLHIIHIQWRCTSDH